MLLAGHVKKEGPAIPAPSLDNELEQYFLDPEDPDIEVNVLAWWKAKASKWAALADLQRW